MSKGNYSFFCFICPTYHALMLNLQAKFFFITVHSKLFLSRIQYIDFHIQFLLIDLTAT